jgi:hypothetical protein
LIERDLGWYCNPAGVFGITYITFGKSKHRRTDPDRPGLFFPGQSFVTP